MPDRRIAITARPILVIVTNYAGVLDLSEAREQQEGNGCWPGCKRPELEQVSEMHNWLTRFLAEAYLISEIAKLLRLDFSQGIRGRRKSPSLLCACILTLHLSDLGQPYSKDSWSGILSHQGLSDRLATVVQLVRLSDLREYARVSCGTPFT